MSIGASVCDNRQSKKKFIFLLDGDSIINFINKKLFQSLRSQLNVVESHNPKNAIEILNSLPEQPDLIVIDLHLPFMSGWDFIEMCRHKGLKSKFFILTSELTPAEINKAKLNPNIVGYGEKPLLSEGIEHIFSCIEEKVN